jgi:hypothetical protein
LQHADGFNLAAPDHNRIRIETPGRAGGYMYFRVPVQVGCPSRRTCDILEERPGGGDRDSASACVHLLRQSFHVSASSRGKKVY